MNPTGCVHFREICRRNNEEAERIMARHREADLAKRGGGVPFDTYETVPHASAPPDHHVWPGALPHTPAWREEPPVQPGRYRWRMTPHWEDITRAIDPEGQTWSYRFMQSVAAIRLGGEWFY